MKEEKVLGLKAIIVIKTPVRTQTPSQVPTILPLLFEPVVTIKRRIKPTIDINKNTRIRNGIATFDEHVETNCSFVIWLTILTLSESKGVVIVFILIISFLKFYTSNGIRWKFESWNGPELKQQ